VVAAGTAVNLCLGILYAWSVWKATLVSKDPGAVGMPMSGVNAGWTYLSNSDAMLAYSVCGVTFALVMIPGGRIQDRYGSRVGAIAGGLFLAAGCVVAGLLKSRLGLIVGWGLLGGVGMGLGYAAATPAAVRWFGAYRRGLVVGLVVGGYGAAAVYIAPLAEYLLGEFGLTGSFVTLGGLFAVVVVIAGSLLAKPPTGYLPPAAVRVAATTEWLPSDVRKTWQLYALVALMFGSAQSGLLVIANATPILGQTAKAIPFLAANLWVLAAFGGAVNAAGRVGTGLYSDRLGRLNAYTLNGLVSCVCLLAVPYVIAEKIVPLLFLVLGVAYWQYGGGLALLPALTADFFGAKHLGANYGLVFLGWGLAFFVPQLAGVIEDETGSLSAAFYLSAGILAACVLLSRKVTRPAGP
jgi:OFA family oxalate/formate antiporter-like MFS transporter